MTAEPWPGPLQERVKSWVFVMLHPVLQIVLEIHHSHIGFHIFVKLPGRSLEELTRTLTKKLQDSCLKPYLSPLPFLTLDPQCQVITVIILSRVRATVRGVILSSGYFADQAFLHWIGGRGRVEQTACWTLLSCCCFFRMRMGGKELVF